jgi:hypothetical protein
MSVRLSAPSRQEMKSPRSAIPASDGDSTRWLKHANALRDSGRLGPEHLSDAGSMPLARCLTHILAEKAV